MIVLLLLAQLAPVPGFANTYELQDLTNSTGYLWAGNPMCIGQGYNYTLLPTSPAIDMGTITEINCPNPGSAINQPRLADGSYCSEWFGKAPDIGACEFVPAPSPPLNLRIQ